MATVDGDHGVRGPGSRLFNGKDLTGWTPKIAGFELGVYGLG
jgi:hypothetical protein